MRAIFGEGGGEARREEIGVFFLVLVLLVRSCAFSAFFGDSYPSFGLQFAVIVSLSLALYSVLKLRHRQQVLQPLGWVWPTTAYIVAALVGGVSLASGVALYLRFRNQSAQAVPIIEILVLGFVLGPILEESLFRGCLLPVLAQTIGNPAAVILTALLFALLHQPSNLAHWVAFTATGVAYGWIRVASRSTTAGALMHATYNLVLFLSDTF